jgi:hypothetical protein
MLKILIEIAEALYPKCVGVLKNQVVNWISNQFFKAIVLVNQVIAGA